MRPRDSARRFAAIVAASTAFAALTLIACAAQPRAGAATPTRSGHVGTVRATCGPTDGPATSFLVPEDGSIGCADGHSPAGAHLLLEIWGSPPMGGAKLQLRGEEGHAQRCVAGSCEELEDARLELAPDHGSGDVTYTLADGLERRLHFTTVRCEKRMMCG